MGKNLATADTIVKLVLAISVTVAYATGLIEGPTARLLMILSVMVIILYVIKIAEALITRD